MVSKIVYAVPVLLVLFISGCTTTETYSNCDSCCPTCTCPQPKDKAMLSAYSNEVYVNLYNESEVYFEATVLNYGYVEGKDIELTCHAYYDSFSEPIIIATGEIGNLASLSFKEVSITAEIEPNLFERYSMGEDYYIYCVPTDCRDCLLLEGRIPEYQDFFS